MSRRHRVIALCATASFLVAGFVTPAAAQEAAEPEEPATELSAVGEPAAETETREPRGLGRRLLYYIPNRLVDVLDIVRARVRVGPGLAVGARATKPVSVFIGGYTSGYIGLPGPRGEPKFPPILGVENYSGLQISVAGQTADTEHGPNYGLFEVGAGAQLWLVGVDAGVALGEIFDLLAGLILFDPRGDDY